MSNQVEASGVQQIGTDPNSMLVLGLRPLMNSLRVHQGQLLPIWCLQTFVVMQGLWDSSG